MKNALATSMPRILANAIFLQEQPGVVSKLLHTLGHLLERCSSLTFGMRDVVELLSQLVHHILRHSQMCISTDSWLCTCEREGSDMNLSSTF
jgi:hypothetical protein